MKIDDKDLDKIVSDYAQDDSKHELPSNFTYNVMQKVEAAAQKKAASKKPLIGFVGWLIFGSFAAMIALAVIYGSVSTTGFGDKISTIDFSRIYDEIKLGVYIVSAVATLIFVDMLFRKLSNKRKLS